MIGVEDFSEIKAAPRDGPAGPGYWFKQDQQDPYRRKTALPDGFRQEMLPTNHPMRSAPFMRVLHAVEGTSCWVAGGAVRDWVIGQAPRDIDLFSAGHSSATRATDLLVKHLDGRVAEANDAVTRVDTSVGRVDIVRSAHYATATELVGRFDFVACCACVDTEGQLTYHRDFEDDAPTRILRVNALPTPVATYWRALRLRDRGWSIDQSVLDQIVEQAVDRPEADGWLSGDSPAKGMPYWASAAWQALRGSRHQSLLPKVMARAVQDPDWARIVESTALLSGIGLTDRMPNKTRLVLRTFLLGELGLPTDSVTPDVVSEMP